MSYSAAQVDFGADRSHDRSAALTQSGLAKPLAQVGIFGAKLLGKSLAKCFVFFFELKQVGKFVDGCR